ncbi:rhodanese-like domain-containing protein [Achromobacter aloeverae]
MTQASPSSSSPAVLTPKDLLGLLDAAGELAILDVRPHGVYARGHLLLSASAPYWNLELEIDRLAPRRDAQLVLVDDGDGLAGRAARKLAALGYTRVALLEGGIAGWQAAGQQLFSGTNVLSKAFGEVLEHELGTPSIDAADLKQRLRRGDKLVVVDSRTPEEFANFSIPGAYSLPGAELVYRIGEVAPDPDTLVVVNCAGRTRSIVGAQTLINAGIPNEVVSLRDGTMAWLLNGDTLDHGKIRPAPAPSARTLAEARARAERVASRASVDRLDDAGLQRLLSQPGRTVYRFDVRDRQEYLAGHLPGWRWAPGGQLVQATDEYAATRGAHIVLADWDGVRALTTAAWLAQLGAFQVHVYPVALRPGAALETGEEPVRVLRAHVEDAPAVAPTELARWLEEGDTAVFDIENSVAYTRRHIAGARFVGAHALEKTLAALPAATRVVLTSADGLLAHSVARELQSEGRAVHALRGGNRAWFDAGLETGAGREGIETGEEDTWYGPYVYRDLAERDAKFRAYLDWEIGLVAQLEREPRVGINLKGSLRAEPRQSGASAS